ncbi:hypothetical protein C9374_014711 [Naegleria lovaniensis]|uniref:Uncharacterized protein n=1 Tax=Naegleria lovaniensis TaxID=51637 RepID=A0AA88KGY2_NAELO|nr:uncharacterized protein C9374_014711 [Naegleria lovaniensis]KAG2370648.1 hypothetical protein C9374_014711 [Naegleria lovaniensis]
MALQHSDHCDEMNPKGFSFTEICSHTFNITDPKQYMSKVGIGILACRNEFIRFLASQIDIHDMSNNNYELIKTFKYPFDQFVCTYSFGVTYCEKDHSCLLTNLGVNEYRKRLIKMSLSDGSVKWSTLLNNESDVTPHFLTPVIDSRGIIFLGDTNSQQIYVICCDSGQVLEKIGDGCRKQFASSVKQFTYLSLDRNDCLLAYCVGTNDVPILKIFSRNLQLVKTIQLDVYLIGPTIWDPISSGYLLRGFDKIYFASRDFNILAQQALENIQYSYFAISNGVLFVFEAHNNKLTCYK